MLCIEFFKSTVGKKIVMALSGIVLVGFVVGHMIGNLKMFMGAPHGAYKIDLYGEFLRDFGSPLLGHGGVLWLVRFVLLGCVVAHAWSGISLACGHRRAKPRVAEGVHYSSANAASRTMIYGGMILVVFIIFHILHFTTGHLHFRGFQEGRIYANVWQGFQSPGALGFYVLAMFCLAMHLYHGVWSMFQTLGVTSPSWNCGLRLATKILAVLVFFGFCSVPVSVAAGVLSPPQVSVQIADDVGGSQH